MSGVLLEYALWSMVGRLEPRILAAHVHDSHGRAAGDDSAAARGRRPHRRRLLQEEVAQRLEICARTAKAHSDALRQKLGVPRRRQIPAAFRRLTGEDPLGIPLGSSSGDR